VSAVVETEKLIRPANFGAATQSLTDKPMADITVFIVAESLIDCQLLTSILERPRSGLKVAACAISKSEFAAALSAQTWDISLVTENLRDGPLTGFQVLNEQRQLSPKARSIMLLKSDDSDLVVDAFRAGAKGVFCGTESLNFLPKCIRAVHNGHIWANSSQLDRVMEAFSEAAPFRPLTAKGRRLLTKREEEVVRLVVEGYSNREAAGHLGITEHTVSNYLFKVYDKLGISSRVELVLYSLQR
jgi:two-component system, NarL family, nitrate/nitrite response regulator NarL